MSLEAHEEDESTVILTITDDGVGMDEKAISEIFSNTGNPNKGMFREIGIRNVAKRIEYTFGQGYTLTLESKLGFYTKAILRLPKLTKEGKPWQPN